MEAESAEAGLAGLPGGREGRDARDRGRSRTQVGLVHRFTWVVVEGRHSHNTAEGQRRWCWFR